MLGFNFYRGSKRYISPSDCRFIINSIEKIGLNTVKVGIFVNHELDQIKQIMDECKLNLAQLSGDESSDLLKSLGNSGVKCIRPPTLESLESFLKNYPERPQSPQFVVDANIEGHFGGTGIIADWAIAKELGKSVEIMLAGGLNPGNIEEAIETVHPWGVDAASGIEKSPGIKDHKKIVAFIETARRTDPYNKEKYVNQI